MLTIKYYPIFIFSKLFFGVEGNLWQHTNTLTCHFDMAQNYQNYQPCGWLAYHEKKVPFGTIIFEPQPFDVIIFPVTQALILFSPSRGSARL